jgi:hypothetical protein
MKRYLLLSVILVGCVTVKPDPIPKANPSSTSPMGLIIVHGKKNTCPVETIARWELELVTLVRNAGLCKADPALTLRGKTLTCVDTPTATMPGGRVVNGWATNVRAEISWNGNLARTKSLFFHETGHMIAYGCDEDVDHWVFRQLEIDSCGSSCKE